jgi:hypothetical protein
MTRSKTRTTVPGSGIGRRAALAGVGSLLAFPAIHARAQTSGVALVIGNSKYQWESQLPNVRRDAPDIAKRFQAFGLQTELVQDVGLAAMRQALDKFGAASNGASLSAFYFAGHGVTTQDGTFLVPVDADLSNPSAVANLVGVGGAVRRMARAANRLVVLDNCRNNPADGWRQRAAEQQAGSRQAEGGNNDSDPPNTLVLFSTAPGRVALDGPAGQNSPFAASLLRQLGTGSVDLGTLPGRLRRDLLIATEARQVLWDRNNYQQPFVMSGPRAASAGAQGGWGNDPSRLLELNNAYAFAAQNGMPAPPGLVAHRAPAGSRDGQKVGSFKFTGPNQDPAVLIVMSVDDQQTAEIIMLFRDNQRRAKWRFLRGTAAGDSVDFLRPEGNVRFNFKWSDANSGWVSMLTDSAKGGKMGNQAFARLDG